MPRRRRRLDEANPVHALALQLQQLRDSAATRPFDSRFDVLDRPKRDVPLTVREVAARYGSSPASIYAALSGTRLPSATTLRAIVRGWASVGDDELGTWFLRLRSAEIAASAFSAPKVEVSEARRLGDPNDRRIHNYLEQYANSIRQVGMLSAEQLEHAVTCIPQARRRSDRYNLEILLSYLETTRVAPIVRGWRDRPPDAPGRRQRDDLTVRRSWRGDLVDKRQAQLDQIIQAVLYEMKLPEFSMELEFDRFSSEGPLLQSRLADREIISTAVTKLRERGVDIRGVSSPGSSNMMSRDRLLRAQLEFEAMHQWHPQSDADDPIPPK